MSDGSADLGSVEGEARSRTKRLVRGIGTAFVSRGLSALAPLALVPVALSAMGVELFGVWMTVVALTSMILWADLGLGNGLLTRLTTSWTNGDFSGSRSLVSTAYMGTSVIAGILIGGLWVSSGVVDWSAVFGAANTEVAAEAGQLGLVCLTVFVVNIPLSLVQRVMYATQRIAEANLWQGLGPVLSLGLAAGAAAASASPVMIAASASSGVILANLLCSARVYGSFGKGLRPTINSARVREVRELLGLGGKFFLLSVLTSTAMNADNLIVNQVLGLAAVAVFAVQARIANLLGMLINLVNLPLWPANGEALVRGDVAWVKRMTLTMCLVSLGAVAAGTMLVVGLGPSFAGMLGLEPGSFDRSLFVALGLWWALVAATSSMAMVQNSQGILWPQLVGWSAFLILTVPAKIFAVGLLGAVAAPAVAFIVFTFTVLPAQWVGYRTALRRSI